MILTKYVVVTSNGTIEFGGSDEAAAWVSANAPGSQIQVIEEHVAEPVLETQTEMINRVVIQRAEALCNDAIDTFKAENVLMGITQYGKTEAVTAYLSAPVPGVSEIGLMAHMSQGNVDMVEKILGAMNPPANLAPFVTPARILAVRNKMRTFLNLPLL